MTCPQHRQRPPDRPAVRWIAHHHVQLVLLIGIVLASSAIGREILFIVDPVTDLVILLLAMAAFLVSLICSFAHMSRLCPDCMAQMPLDPQNAIETHDDKLRLFHRLRTPRGALAFVVAIFTVSIMQTLLGPFGFVATLAFWSMMAYEMRVVTRHRVLQQWCPYCRDDDDDDDEEHTPTPMPVERATR